MEKQIETFVIRAKEGDREAFGKLFELTNQKAYYTALKITENPRDAEDMVQDAYVKAFKSLDKLSDEAKFEKWLDRIVANNCRDLAKKHTPDLFSTFDNEEGDLIFEDSLESMDLSDLPEQVTDNKAVKNIVMECIDKLPFEQRMCVVMFYYNELSVSEIAESLGVPQGTVKSRLNKARKTLRKQFEDIERTGNVKLYSASLPLMVAGVFRLCGESFKIPLLSLIKITRNIPNVFLSNGLSTIIKTVGITGIIKRVLFGAGAVVIITGGSMAAHEAIVELRADPVVTTSVVSETTTEHAKKYFFQGDGKKALFKDKEDTKVASAVAISDGKKNTYFINEKGVYCSDKRGNTTQISNHKPLNLYFGDCLMYIYEGTLYKYKSKKLIDYMSIAGDYLYGKGNETISISADRNSAYFIDIVNKTYSSVEDGCSEFKFLGKMLYYRNADNVIKRVSFEKDGVKYESLLNLNNEEDLKIPYNVKDGKIYYTAFNSDVTGELFVIDTVSKNTEKITLSGGITDYSVSKNNIYYSLTSGGLYLYTKDKEIIKLADGNYYCSTTSNGSMIWCSTDDSSAYLIKSGGSEMIYIENGSEIIEFSIIDNTLYYRGDNGYDSVRL